MRYILVFPLFLVFLIFVFAGCEKDNAPVGTSGSGILTIYLTDSPTFADFDSVNITFSQISAHLDSEWVMVQGETTTVNLRELNNGKTIVFGSSEVPAGKYTQIRIKIDDAYVVMDDGQKHPLSVPSGAQTGLKLGPQFTIMEGFIYELVVDFNVNQSIVLTGPPDYPTGYKLKPHLRVIPKKISGSISGTITNPDSLPAAFAIQNSDTITTTLVNPADGFFRLSFLSAGLYTVSIRDSIDRSATIDNVVVVAGINEDLGDITLQ